jgi:hypothetical protein
MLLWLDPARAKEAFSVDGFLYFIEEQINGLQLYGAGATAPCPVGIWLVLRRNQLTHRGGLVPAFLVSEGRGPGPGVEIELRV